MNNNRIGHIIIFVLIALVVISIILLWRKQKEVEEAQNKAINELLTQYNSPLSPISIIS